MSGLSVTWAKSPLFLRYVLIFITVLELIYTACTHGYHTSRHFSINYVPSKTSSQYQAIERGAEGMKRKPQVWGLLGDALVWIAHINIILHTTYILLGIHCIFVFHSPSVSCSRFFRFASSSDTCMHIHCCSFYVLSWCLSLCYISFISHVHGYFNVF